MPKRTMGTGWSGRATRVVLMLIGYCLGSISVSRRGLLKINATMSWFSLNVYNLKSLKLVRLD